MRNHAIHALFLTAALALCSVWASAQVATAVDTIHVMPANVNVPKLLQRNRDTIAAASVTLLDLLELKYGREIRGLTQEQQTTRFDITGKIDPPGVSDPEHNPHAQDFLLDALLKNHFHLKAHDALEDVTFKWLSVIPTGTKFTQSPPGCPTSRDIDTSSHIASQDMSMFSLTKQLSKDLHTEIKDTTNLRGSYVINLDWSPEGVVSHLPPSTTAQFASHLSLMSSEDLLQFALQTQLGLMLVTAHSQKRVTIIDYIELPASVIWLQPKPDSQQTALSSSH